MKARLRWYMVRASDACGVLRAAACTGCPQVRVGLWGPRTGWCRQTDCSVVGGWARGVSGCLGWPVTDYSVV